MMGDAADLGIIPMAVEEIFEHIEKVRGVCTILCVCVSYRPQTHDREFLLRVSYMEIYNEVITDLLNTSNTNLKINERNGEIYVGALTEEVVCSAEHIMHLMSQGHANRHVGSTKMNERSSAHTPSSASSLRVARSPSAIRAPAYQPTARCSWPS